MITGPRAVLGQVLAVKPAAIKDDAGASKQVEAIVFEINSMTDDALRAGQGKGEVCEDM